MIGNNTFDWTVLENLLNGSASRNMHGSFSFYIHWPGYPSLSLPAHLSDVVPMFETASGPTPDYNDPAMIEAYDQFITALGARYDGDKRVAFIHVGLLGFWGKCRSNEIHFFCDLFLPALLNCTCIVGEFHCQADFCVDPSTTAHVINKFMENFKVTQIQVRYPEDAVDGTGLYDASFAYETLDGEANGGVTHSWFFWPKVLKAERQDLWKSHVSKSILKV